MTSHWRRFNRALDHIQALDKSICAWLNRDAYRIVKEHDPKTRRTAFVAKIDSIPNEWPDLVSYAVHGLRSALEHLAFALNSKGYADAHGGAAIPAERESESSFPIFGNVNQRGQPMDGERAFKNHTSYRDMPADAKALIEKLQPYQRGKDFRRDPLWAIHELSRVDKHRIDLEISASPLISCSTATFLPLRTPRSASEALCMTARNSRIGLSPRAVLNLTWISTSDAA